MTSQFILLNLAVGSSRHTSRCLSMTTPWRQLAKLIALGEQEGFGVTFNPDPEGWTIGYMRGMVGGDLLSGFDLGDTARASMRPLLDLAASYEAKRRERERQEQ